MATQRGAALLARAGMGMLTRADEVIEIETPNAAAHESEFGT